jgi:cytochrome c oxidase subunit II
MRGFPWVFAIPVPRGKARMTVRRPPLGPGATALVLLVGGCEGVQSILHPRGPQAEQIATLGWAMFAAAAAIFLLVMALIAFAWFRRPQRDWFGSSRLIVGGGLIFPTVTLTALLIYSIAPGGLAGRQSAPEHEIEVVGYQWWWEVRYRDGNGDVAFTTANEIRLPTGRPVRTRVSTADVIHSFWLPNLAGKIDMIPGRVNELLLEASEAGTFRGQCAEYCGGPHTWMAFYAVAAPPDQFTRWFERQQEPAAEPQTALLQQGLDVFQAFGCGGCHAIRGTEAVGGFGPDLTHFGGRRTIGAGILDNTIENLEAWIADSQRIKPNNLMPPFDFIESEDLHALAAYLKSLQ